MGRRSGCYYDYYYHLDGMRFYILVFIEELYSISLGGIVTDRYDDECGNASPLLRHRMSIFSQITNAVAYMVAQQIKTCEFLSL